MKHQISHLKNRILYTCSKNEFLEKNTNARCLRSFEEKKTECVGHKKKWRAALVLDRRPAEHGRQGRARAVRVHAQPAPVALLPQPRLMALAARRAPAAESGSIHFTQPLLFASGNAQQSYC